METNYSWYFLVLLILICQHNYTTTSKNASSKANGILSYLLQMFANLAKNPLPSCFFIPFTCRVYFGLFYWRSLPLANHKDTLCPMSIVNLDYFKTHTATCYELRGNKLTRENEPNRGSYPPCDQNIQNNSPPITAYLCERKICPHKYVYLLQAL